MTKPKKPLKVINESINIFHLLLENGDWVRLTNSSYLTTSEDFKKVFFFLIKDKISKSKKTTEEKNQNKWILYMIVLEHGRHQIG